ncbi:hypothetical protein O6H91_17G032000 [Diphasiastrum complanatum]|uniref:Uncharacterized protein n=7 Tax=Diphasiastrum complanatum TaxID=34168 RepID=A0ACC2B6K2_DIPCM|nr:hypothetical protein O6H91_17G032000 [Diphasiastrum complanatum]KAJ7525006.1 hypothetical protein O6H91_17G032000 [Diphasiastrum complanatum]KAJ7525007.1 hypothetical protein O6H91_17G032000 [Diphasiastrum complanatum]KAJ7525008.1 hypothetical protein O6H91_17G032000 [Diphasiastrum complanatum]KAJ7525009.1 hypothetical protein O6H91_17G032000 [Diphasiastrum complanatum]
MGSNNNSYSIPVTSFPSHQLSNGLYVSGRPDQYKERGPTMSTAAAPYTGGDIKKSGELGKMFDIPVEAPKLKPSGSVGGSQGKTTGVILSRSNSGPLPSGAPRSAFSTSGPLSSAAATSKHAPQRCNSGPLTGLGVQGSKSGPLITGPSGAPLKTSGPLSGGATPNVLKTSGPLAPQLPATGLITSGPILSGPLSSSRKASSGPLDKSASGKFVAGHAANQAINKLSNNQVYSFTRSFPRVILWTVIPLFVMGFIAGGFILAAVQNAILLIVVATLFVALLVLLIWNTCWGNRAILGFVDNFPDTQLSNAKNGQYVKVTGVVTCGSVPLESSYQKVNRCIYTSTLLREYRSSSSKPANEKQLRFSWALRHLERHVVDFYISDFHSGLRALVKAGSGASVTPYVEESSVVEVLPKSKELPTDFVRWLMERNLSREDRKMQLREGYIKEGNTVTVLGVVQRHENLLMIVPPPEPVSTGCQWGKFLLPAYTEGLVIRSEETSKVDGIPL